MFIKRYCFLLLVLLCNACCGVSDDLRLQIGAWESAYRRGSVVNEFKKRPVAVLDALDGRLFHCLFADFVNKHSSLQSLKKAYRDLSDTDKKQACITREHRADLEDSRKKVIKAKNKLRVSEKLVMELLDIEIDYLKNNKIVVNMLKTNALQQFFSRAGYCKPFFKENSYSKKFLKNVVAKNALIEDLVIG